MRLKMESGTCVYHCVTRTVAGARLLGEVEREVLRKLLWRVADFSGVEVLSYCIMSNHLHVLVRVPEIREEELTRGEILRRYRALYSSGRAGFFPEPEDLERLFADPESEEAARWEARLRVRMHDVSHFMKTLKQRFSVWYNQTHERFGTLWAERFRSTVVENDPVSLRVVAAYIDLNPVRAGLVDDPGDYRWSSYGEAMGGEANPQAGLAAVVGQLEWLAARAEYRLVLFGKGSNGRVGQQGILSRELVAAVVAEDGEVPLASLLRCKVRYFSDGAVLGSRAFVLEMEAQMRRSGAAGGRKPRRAGALPASDSAEMCVLRPSHQNPVT